MSGRKSSTGSTCRRDTDPMSTAVGGDFREPERPVTGCWCCGDETVSGSLLRLVDHPEVGVCFRCVGRMSKRKREIERMTRRAPIGRPWWRRVLYRLGYNRC